MALTPGTRLGPYEIVCAIGAGGMGEVYKARDTRLDRTVAVKILPSADPDRRERFAREAKAIAALSHPHICVLHDVGQQPVSTDGGQSIDFIVIEYLEGETLADRLKAGPLALDVLLDLAIQVADALDAAHGANVIHRKMLDSGDPVGPTFLALSYARAGRRADALAIVRKLEGEFQRTRQGSFLVAAVYAALGDRDQAFRWLEEAYRAHDTFLPWLKVDPEFDNLRGDARFDDLVRRIGIP